MRVQRSVSLLRSRVARRRFLLFAGIVLAALFAWFTVDLATVATGAEEDHATHADVILLLGCRALENGTPTPCIRARSRHAADLYANGLAANIIASGGPSQSGPAEAGIMAGLLRGYGVPDAAITREDRSHNTIQNILNSQEIMREHGWRIAVLVTEPYHIKRAQIIARDNGLTVYPSPAVDSPDWQQPFPRAVLLGEDAAKLMYYQVKGALGIRD